MRRIRSSFVSAASQLCDRIRARATFRMFHNCWDTRCECSVDRHKQRSRQTLPGARYVLFSAVIIIGHMRHLTVRLSRGHTTPLPKKQAHSFFFYGFGSLISNRLVVAGADDWCVTRSTRLGRHRPLCSRPNGCQTVGNKTLEPNCADSGSCEIQNRFN